MYQPFYYILTFSSTRDAISGEQYAKEQFAVAVMPLPQEISSGCGLALRFLKAELAEILSFCEEIPLTCTLYKMDTVKTDGVRRIEKLYGKTL